MSNANVHLVSRKYGSTNWICPSWRIDEYWTCSDSVWPQPKKLFCEICPVRMKFSYDENPAPIWNVPVERSFTETRATSLSSPLPRSVLMFTFSKKPSAVTRDFDSVIADALK